MKRKDEDKKSLIGHGATTITGSLGATTSTGTFSFTNCFREEFRSAEFLEKEGVIEMIYEKIPTILISDGFGNKTPNKSMLKKIYGVKDGKLQLINTIEGIEEPGYYVEPQIEWKE